MKNILCYGDSNTWGLPPGEVGRYPWPIRWPGVLQTQLGERHRVIEAGLPGRTTCFDDPFSPYRNGLSYLPVSLEMHSPLDLLIIMLGTNDLKTLYGLTPFHIARGAAALVECAQKFEPSIAHILLIAPPHMTPTEDFDNVRAFADGVEKSQAVAAQYERVATTLDCHFLDAATLAQFSPIDGIHMDEANHQRLGEGVSAAVKTLLAPAVPH